MAYSMSGDSSVGGILLRGIATRHDWRAGSTGYARSRRRQLPGARRSVREAAMRLHSPYGIVCGCGGTVPWRLALTAMVSHAHGEQGSVFMV